MNSPDSKIPKSGNSQSLKIVPASEKPLSKNQQRFNLLCEKIKQQRTQISEENKKLERLLHLYAYEVKPVSKRLAGTQIEIAKMLSAAVEFQKFSKNQYAEIKRAILILLNSAFSQIEPDKATISLYDQWSESTVEEEKASYQAEIHQEIAAELSSRFGVKVDSAEISDDPEEMEILLEKLQAERERRTGNRKPGHKKKNKKESGTDKKRMEQQEIKTKNVRSIYMNLIKLLHPDAEQDPERKIEKEELVKKVTAAYENNDFSGLLALEMEWANTENAFQAMLPEEKLAEYVSVLDEQVKDLERSKIELKQNPRFGEIAVFSGMSLPNATREIRNLVSQYQYSDVQFKNIISDYESTRSGKRLMQFVNDFVEHNEMVRFETEEDGFF